MKGNYSHVKIWNCQIKFQNKYFYKKSAGHNIWLYKLKKNMKYNSDGKRFKLKKKRLKTYRIKTNNQEL